MPIIELQLAIQAPVERVFDLSRSVDMHQLAAGGTNERAIGGVTSGLVQLGDEVLWSARHFGVRQELRVRITEFDRPMHFRDSMVSGAFKGFDHDHEFEEIEAGCLLREHFQFQSPFGPLGLLADQLFLTRYMKRFLSTRNQAIKRAAESDEWMKILSPPSRGTRHHA